MPNRMYEKGRRFEYEIVEDMRNKGWWSRRMPASKSEYDVIAIKNGVIRGIQAKNEKDGKGYIEPEKRNLMIQNFKEHKIFPLIAVKEKQGRKSVIKYKIIL